MVDGLEIFHIEPDLVLKYISQFHIIKKEKGDYHAMECLFSEALDSPEIYNFLLLNAWKSIIDMSNDLIEGA